MALKSLIIREQTNLMKNNSKKVSDIFADLIQNVYLCTRNSEE